MLNTTGARLSAALLGYVTLVIALLTLNPFYLALPKQIQFSLHTSPGDVLANIMLFLPIGFLYRLTSRRGGASLAGAGISVGIETLQLFIPARTASVMDIASNALGAGLGAIIHDLLSKHIEITSNTVGRLRLETPLMGFVYLLVPLLWVNSLALGESSDRWILTTLIGVCGAIMLSDVYRQWWKHARFKSAVYAALSAGTWFLVGSGPNLLRIFPTLMIGIGVTLLTAALTFISRPFTDRRFEHTTLKRVLPFFALYIFLAAVWYPLRPFEVWHGTLGFTSRLADTSLQDIYPRIEYLTAFTVLGYLSAEWRGRSEIPLARDLPRLIAIATGCALALEFLVGFQTGSGASLIRAILAAVSALFGGAIYHLLRDHVRFLLRNNTR